MNTFITQARRILFDLRKEMRRCYVQSESYVLSVSKKKKNGGVNLSRASQVDKKSVVETVTETHPSGCDICLSLDFKKDE